MTIKSHVANDAYRGGWDAVFGKKEDRGISEKVLKLRWPYGRIADLLYPPANVVPDCHNPETGFGE